MVIRRQCGLLMRAFHALFGLRFTILFITCLLLFLKLIPFNITLLFRQYLRQYKPLLDAFQGPYIITGLHFILFYIEQNFSLQLAIYIYNTISLRPTVATVILIATFHCLLWLPSAQRKYKMVNSQELSLLTNITVMHAVSTTQQKYFLCCHKFHDLFGCCTICSEVARLSYSLQGKDQAVHMMLCHLIFLRVHIISWFAINFSRKK